jgi:hypothetical protein
MAVPPEFVTVPVTAPAPVDNVKFWVVAVFAVTATL